MERPEELITAAKKEDWDFVDREIPKYTTDKETVEWACEEGISNDDGNVRDLAVSILEKAELNSEKYETLRDELYNLMVSDPSPYVRFRSAFTLAAHGVGPYKQKVEEVLQEAIKDEDVSEIAENYLREVNS